MIQGVLGITSKKKEIAVLRKLIKDVIGFSKYEQSAEITITLQSSATVAHTLGIKPILVKTMAVCKTAEYGYAVGDELDLSTNANDGTPGANSETGFSVAVTATNFKYVIGDDIPVLNYATPAAQTSLTPSNWRLVVRLWG